LSLAAILVPLSFFSTGSNDSAVAALGVLIPFALPALGLLVFLVLTGKERTKPWPKRQQEPNCS
jgi:hypothetical protein